MSMQSWFTRNELRANRSKLRLVLGAAVMLSAGSALGWDPLPVDQDPLIRMPGTQHNDGVNLDSSTSCLACHGGYDPPTEPGAGWSGSMMGQAARDPIFWATLAVAAQDSIWAVGRPNATDICLRCHTPPGWLGGRSDPTNGSALTGHDFDGVSCSFCHAVYDPFFEDTASGAREGNDWLGYWDETDLSATPSSAAAMSTLQSDRALSASVSLFNGNPFFGPGGQPVSAPWNENGGGQMFVTASTDRRASFADADASHGVAYSRHHKSRYFCGTCHDVSNPVLANLSFEGTSPGDGSTVLETESSPAYAYSHVERTFSEFMLSAYGTGAGADGVGPFDPSVYETSQPGNQIGSCQDCHMRDRTGRGSGIGNALTRPTESTEHPNSGVPQHDMTGGNAFVPRLLASTLSSSSAYDPTNEALLGGATRIPDLSQGEPLDPAALLDASNRAISQLLRAAAITQLSYDPGSGTLGFRVQNQTGHKLISGYPEGRRMFVNVRVMSAGSLVWEVNPYDYQAATLRGLDLSLSPNSPPTGPNEEFRDDLVFETKLRSSLTGEDHTFHFALATGRFKDNRIPPKGFRIGEAANRLAEPFRNGVSDASVFTAAEYLGGYDEINLTVPSGADAVEVRLFYQTTSREYVEFLRDEINGAASSLTSPTPSGEPNAYVAQTDPFFTQLNTWGDTIWELWNHNRHWPGAAPVLMAHGATGNVTDPCAAPSSDGTACDDGNGCTPNDVCAAGHCVPGPPVVCAPADECQAGGSCENTTGVCTYSPLPDGTPCSSGECTAGVCGPLQDAGADSSVTPDGAVDGGLDAPTLPDTSGPDGLSQDSSSADVESDGATPVVSSPPAEDDGCSCAVVGSRSSSTAWLFASWTLLARSTHNCP